MKLMKSPINSWELPLATSVSRISVSSEVSCLPEPSAMFARMERAVTKIEIKIQLRKIFTQIFFRLVSVRKNGNRIYKSDCR